MSLFFDIRCEYDIYARMNATIGLFPHRGWFIAGETHFMVYVKQWPGNIRAIKVLSHDRVSSERMLLSTEAYGWDAAHSGVPPSLH